MTTSDGSVLGVTQIAGSGPAAVRWNLVLLSEGYRASEMTQYAADADDFVAHLFAMPPFSDIAHAGLIDVRYSDAINVWRVDVASTDSGADDPAACGGTGATAATYFDASFCNNGVQRLLAINSASAFNVAYTEVPNAKMVMVLVNSPIFGGSGGAVATFSRAPHASEIGIHEMGHTAFGFGDEYDYFAGCGIDRNRDIHPPIEPYKPNVTIDSNRATIKWGDLIDPATPMPTKSNPDCSTCDRGPSPMPLGTVGAFEGADYYHCRAFRPEYHNCKMQDLSLDFCAVCRREIRTHLWPYVPMPLSLANLAEVFIEDVKINWIPDPVPWGLIRLIEALSRSRGQVPPIQQDALTQLLTRLEQMDAGQLRATLLRVKTDIVRLEAESKMIQTKLSTRT